MAFLLPTTLEKPDENNIHELRRICLRLRHALRIFSKLVPEKPRRRVQKRLRELQDLLAAVRGCDVALEVLKLGPLAGSVAKPEGKRIVAALGLERRRCLRPLRWRLQKMQRSDAVTRWRNRLVAR